MDVLAEFPVRKGKRKKQAFRGAVRSYGERLGYVYAEEKGALGVRNVLFGDPEKADYLVTAHYDTCARLPFPNFITPCNVGIYLLYQIVVALLFCVPVLGAVWLAACLTESPLAMLLTGYGCLILLVWLLLCGPANRHNANDFTLLAFSCVFHDFAICSICRVDNQESVSWDFSFICAVLIN